MNIVSGFFLNVLCFNFCPPGLKRLLGIHNNEETKPFTKEKKRKIKKAKRNRKNSAVSIQTLFYRWSF